MIYYISDLHLFHNKIIEKYNRPFASIEEMHDCIIRNWRNTVKKDDIVYVLGDLGMYHAHEIAEIISSLPGNKILITGNHDSWNLKHAPLRKCFKEISTYKEIIDAGRRVVLFHYPIEEWNGFYRGFYHVYGHVHDSPEGVPLSNRERRYNACVEFCDYRPMTLDELIAKNTSVNKKEDNNMHMLDEALIQAVRSDDVEGIEDFLGYEISDVILEELDSRLMEVMGQMPDDIHKSFLKKYHLLPEEKSADSNEDELSDGKAEALLTDFYNKLDEAQQARQKIIDYLEYNYDLDDITEQIENRNDWCFGIDSDTIKHLIETA